MIQQTSSGPPLVLAEPDTPSWGFGEVFVILAVLFISLGLAANLAQATLGDQAKAGYWAVAEEAAGYLLMLVAMKAMFFWQQLPLFQTLGWKKTAFSPAALAGLGVGIFFLTVLLQLVLRTPELHNTPFENMLNSGLASRLAISIFGITLGPAVEELLFRGFLQPVFVSSVGVLPGILVTSAIFGSLHLAQNAGQWRVGVTITVVGFAFGLIRHITGSTQASTISHIAYNSLPFLLTAIQSGHSPSK